MIERKSWDSDFFGYEVGQFRIDSNKEVDFDQLLDESKNFELTYVVSSMELPIKRSLELVDIKVTWDKPCKGIIQFEDSRDGYLIEEFNNSIHSYNELKELTFLSGKYSRFIIDRNFHNNEFLKLYKEWIDRSIDHSIAEKVLVCVFEKHLCGFITIGIKDGCTSKIGLISVNRRYQGRNIGSNLIIVANNFCRENGIELMEVATQKDNLPAMKFYQRNGFQIKSYEYFYHIWNR